MTRNGRAARAPRPFPNIAFTLIELLVVIAIISILMALLASAVRAAKEKANQIKCLSNIRQVALGAMQYAQDNEGFAPDFRSYYGPGVVTASGVCSYNSPVQLSYSTTLLYWLGAQVVEKGYVSPKVMMCPTRNAALSNRIILDACFDTTYYQKPIKNSDGILCSVCGSYALKVLEWEQWGLYAGDPNASAPYRIGDNPNRVLVMELPWGNYGGGMLTHPNGIMVCYEDGMAEFVAVDDASKIVVSVGSSDQFNQFMYILRRDNPKRPYQQ
ncbi:MAG: type II secretion system protein [Verrucomicrobiae bacterium]|nr:type II secretion system protein [Verrucomicrobiae bacterium]